MHGSPQDTYAVPFSVPSERLAIRTTDGRDIPESALTLLLKDGMSLRMNLLMVMARDLSSTAEKEVTMFLRNEIKMSDFDFELTSDPVYIHDQDVSMSSFASCVPT